MTSAGLVGGSDADQERLLALHAAYLEANARFDWEALEGIWSGSDRATFFNLNGHTYVGREHWIGLWKYYAGKLETGAWTPYDIGGTVEDGLAVIWCHRKTRLRWTGDADRPSALHDKDFVSRSTMVFRKEDGDWRVVHVHFSEASADERPGGV